MRVGVRALACLAAFCVTSTTFEGATTVQASKVHVCGTCHQIRTTSSAHDERESAPAAQIKPHGTRTCLGCHDGTAGTFANVSVPGLLAGAYASACPGGHPTSIGFDPRLVALGKFADPSTTPSGLGGTIAEDLLIDGYVECASCHDVHRSTQPHLLAVSNGGSRLCLTCHNK